MLCMRGRNRRGAARSFVRGFCGKKRFRRCIYILLTICLEEGKRKKVFSYRYRSIYTCVCVSSFDLFECLLGDFPRADFFFSSSCKTLNNFAEKFSRKCH